MNIQHKSKVLFQKGLSEKHTLHLEMQMQVENIVDAFGKHNIAVAVLATKSGIREMITKYVLSTVLQNLVRQTGEPFKTEESLDTHSEYSIDNDSTIGIPKIRENRLRIRSILQIILDVEANQPITAMQALFAARGSIATAVAKSILDNLSLELHGISEWEYEMDYNLLDWEFTKLTFTEKETTGETLRN